MKPVGDDAFILKCSGRTICPNRKIIGINPKLETFGGYDDALTDFGPPLADDERKELAEYMIGLWKKYADAKP